MLRLLLLAVFLLPLGALAQPGGHDATIARLKYGGGGDWYSGEESLPMLLAFVRQNTLLDLAPKEDIVELASDKLFQYPYLYLNGHGTVRFTDREAERLRRYLVGGGFLHVNDDYGLDPDAPAGDEEGLPRAGLRRRPVRAPRSTTRTSRSRTASPKSTSTTASPPRAWASSTRAGSSSSTPTRATLGDGWEPPAVHDTPPEKRQAALRMGTNLLVYAMTR